VLSQVAGLLGRPEEQKEFAAKAEQIRRSFNQAFYDRKGGYYGSNSQCANALALVMNLVEPANRAKVLDALVRDVEARGYPSAGDVGFRSLLQALAQGGRSDVIYRLINQDEKPGYGYILKQGATALTEAWDANTNSSHDHFMLGQITEWFYKDLGGIDSDPAGPGFKRIFIKSSLVGDLKWARAGYDSIRGKITSDWRRDGDQFTLKVTIPANTTATVWVPARSAGEVTEGGRPAKQSRGVRFLREGGGCAIFEITAGEYAFQSHP
jgi:alpha-L-rhamnosidase